MLIHITCRYWSAVAFPARRHWGPACFWIYPPNFLRSPQQMELPSHLTPPTPGQHTLQILFPGVSCALSLSWAHRSKQQELSLGYKQLRLLNCYLLCLLTNSKPLICLGCNLTVFWDARVPCNPVPPCHSAARSWADSAGRRGIMGSFSEDVILFLLLHRECQRPLFISSQRVTFTLFICLFVLF